MAEERILYHINHLHELSSLGHGRRGRQNASNAKTAGESNLTNTRSTERVEEHLLQHTQSFNVILFYTAIICPHQGNVFYMY